MRSNGKVVNFSGEGHGVANFVLFIVFFGAFLGCVYALSFWDFHNVWIPGLVCLGLLTIVFFVVKTLLGRHATNDELESEMTLQPRSQTELH